jgi:hypothetical protein
MLRVGSPELNHAFTITSRDSYRAATLIEQQAATIAELREALEDIASVDEPFVRANGTYAAFDKITERARATLERTKQP